ncbi:sulfotransferase [Sphingomonas sp. MMS24-J13]|uniref:tetratricopeptide repeat-containing sulfotransferase family protein n=1 Tax=Sphingomonas sp. MMS24-J13 TaxID=3238686 RepID=UPI00384C2954
MATRQTLDAAHLQRLDAIVARSKSDPAGAFASAKTFTEDYPAIPAGWRVLALTMRAAGDNPAADQIDLRAIALGAQSAGLEAAEREFAAGRLEQAELFVRAYLRDQDARDPGAALLLAKIAARSGARQQAETLAQRALLLAPGFDEARMALAHFQNDAHNAHGALSTLDDLLARAPDHLRGLSLKASILMRLRRMDEADAVFDRLHEQHPADSRGWMNHAFLLKTIGERQEAILAYRNALAANPANGQAWWGFANLKIAAFDETDIVTMETALTRDDISADDRLHLLFALGKALESRERYEEAFTRFSAGAKLRLQQAPHDPNKVWADVGRVRETFTPRFLAEREGWGCPEPDPIFIVSLPRAGSTLVEQILASHSAIEGTEELFDLEKIALEIAPDRPGGYLDRVADLTRDEVCKLGDAYLASTARFRDTTKPRFTDKMPSNWMYAGLIRLILPNAKIIDVRRHPLGCGVANFTQHFNWGINFSYDLDHIGQFYRAYVAQMSHFDRTIPGHIHHLTHEGLIDDLEHEVRRMLAYLDLPFEPACLRFYETRRAVHTPSSEQVRKPINRDGVDRWRHYERWLDPLKTALGPVLDFYPNPPPDQG